MDVLHFLFSSPFSWIAHSVSFLVSQERRRIKKIRVKLIATFKPSWLGLGLELGFGLTMSKRDQKDVEKEEETNMKTVIEERRINAVDRTISQPRR